MSRTSGSYSRSEEAIAGAEEKRAVVVEKLWWMEEEAEAGPPRVARRAMLGTARGKARGSRRGLAAARRPRWTADMVPPHIEEGGQVLCSSIEAVEGSEGKRKGCFGGDDMTLGSRGRWWGFRGPSVGPLRAEAFLMAGRTMGRHQKSTVCGLVFAFCSAMCITNIY